MQRATRGRIARGHRLKSILEEQDVFKRRLKFLCFLAEKLRLRGVDLILVGGEAVEFYTHGQFTTADIDILVPSVGGRDTAMAILRQLGFKPSGRVMFNREIGMAVDVLERLLSGAPEKVKKVELEEGWFRVIGIEDLLVERLVMTKHCGERKQAETALALFKVAPRLDISYLKKRARSQNVADLLEVILDTDRRRQ